MPCCRILTELAIVGVWVPVVIDVFSIKCVVLRVKVEVIGVMSGFGVSIPHVSGGRVTGGFGGYLVLLRGVCADELSLLRE